MVHWETRNADKKEDCAFCGKLQAEVERLLFGYDKNICNECVRRFLKGPQPLKVPTEWLKSWAEVPEDLILCSFCGGVLGDREPGGPQPAVICQECVEMCDSILAEDAGSQG